jgi:RND family efflux transporter MFP subunit
MPSRRTILRAVVLALLLLLATAASVVAGSSAGEDPADRGPLTVEKCLIKVVDRALLAAERDGIVDEVPVREGDIVAADQLMLCLRDEAARMRFELARARAANDVNVRYSRKVADAAMAGYDAGLELEQQKAISTIQLRQRRLEYERGQLSVEQSVFDLKLAELEAAQAKAELKGYYVAAPFSGTVVRVLKRRGESVRNGEPVVELVNSGRVHVEAYCELRDLWNVRAGAPVAVQLDAPELAPFGVTGETFDGKLILVDAVVQPVTGLVRIVAEVPNRGDILRDGLKARMTIDRSESPANESAPAAPESLGLAEPVRRSTANGPNPIRN